MKQSFPTVQFLLLVLVSSFKSGYAAVHEIRTMKGSSFPSKATFASDTSEMLLANVNYPTSTFSQPTVSQVCAFGMWALYNTSNFGQGFETTTNVLTIRGFDPQACASATTFPAIRQVQSIHWLGNVQKELPGLFIFSEPNFLGTRFTAPTGGTGTAPTDDTITQLATTVDMSAIRLGSVAITGPGKWRLCADALCSTAICIDASKYRASLYLNRNVVTDTTANWPAYVRAYQLNPKDTSLCENDGSPPVPVIPKSLAIGNGRKNQLEIF